MLKTYWPAPVPSPHREKMNKAFVVAVSVLFLSGCGGGIQPSYVSESRYEPLDCGALAAERARLEALLGDATCERESIHAEQAVDVLFLDLPITTGRGDHVARQVVRQRAISQLKGNLEAIHAISLRKGCAIWSSAPVR